MPAIPIKEFDFVDFIVLGVLTLVLSGMMLWHHRRNGAVLRSISATVAVEKGTSLIFSVVMSICYPLYYAWLWLWVGPKLEMPSLYYIVLAVAAFFELVFVWVPSTTGWKRQTHEFATTLVGLAMLVIPGMFLLGHKAGSTVGVVSIAVFYAVSLVLSVLLLIPRYRKHTFTYEVIFCVAFLAAASIVGHT